MFSLATSLVVLVSIPFLIVVDHRSGAGYAVLPTNERPRRNSNVVDRNRSDGRIYSATALPEEQVSKCFFSVPPTSCQQPLADDDAPDRTSTESSTLLSGHGNIDGDADATSKKSAHSHSVDITGLALLNKPEFWQIWVLMGLLTGVGLMTIKWVVLLSVGSVSRLMRVVTLVTTYKPSGTTLILQPARTLWQVASCGTCPLSLSAPSWVVSLPASVRT
jgi:hypothetical protein